MTQLHDTPRLSAPIQNGGRRSGSAPSRTSLRPRRRPALVALGVALAAVGGVTSARLVGDASGRAAVLAVAHEIPVGATITSNDLAIAHVGHDPHLTPITASEESSVVGKVAAVTLPAGSLLTSADITSASVPGDGHQLVGVALKPGQLPARPLIAGSNVLVVATPGQAGTAATGNSPGPSQQPIPATVVDVGTPAADGTVVVDLSVGTGEGPAVAAIASTGNVAVVEQPAGS